MVSFSPLYQFDFYVPMLANIRTTGTNGLPAGIRPLCNMLRLLKGIRIDDYLTSGYSWVGQVTGYSVFAESNSNWKKKQSAANDADD